MVRNEKTDQKLKIAGVEIAWVEQNLINIPDSIYQNDQHKKIYLFYDFERVTPTHIDATHAYRRHPHIFKNFAKFAKSNSKAIESKSY